MTDPGKLILSVLIKRLSEIHNSLDSPDKLALLMATTDQLSAELIHAAVSDTVDEETKKQKMIRLLQIHLFNIQSLFDHQVVDQAIVDLYNKKALPPDDFWEEWQTIRDQIKRKISPAKPIAEDKLRAANKILDEVLNDYNKKHGG